MQFWFDVGTHEVHRVAFSFDKVWGRLVITVDGRPAVDQIRMFSVQLVKRYELTVGAQERHHVVIEKERKLFFAGFRPQTYRVLIDGQLVNTYQDA
jgi:hypothetical protein